MWELLWNPPALTPPHPLFLYDIMFVLALLAAPLIISSSWYTIYILLISYINSRLLPEHIKTSGATSTACAPWGSWSLLPPNWPG